VKLVIQIACLNEEETLPVTLAELPASLPGIDAIAVLVIDDGSTDRTVEVAREHSVARIVGFPENRGLAAAFSLGLETSLAMGADVIVHTDADNQYQGGCIGDLIAPVIAGEADIVIGARPIEEIAHFSPLKKALQRFGSSIVRRLSGTVVPDATSGFRAYSREAALRLTVVSEFSYTLETLIEAGQRGLTVTHVPIRTNEKLRESRLFSSIGGYIRKSGLTMLRVYAMYRPLRTFLVAAALAFLPGAALVARFFYYYFTVEGPTGKVQSLIVAGILLMLSVILFVIGLLGDLIASNRKMLEETLYRVRKQELPPPREPSPQGAEPFAKD
jgi:glycosyltransferase involved in cell wall biosynthesis